MPRASTIILPPAELLDDDFLGAELIHDLGDDACALDDRGADGRAVGAGDEQDLGEDEFGARFALAPIDDDPVSFADSKLVATVLKDRVHPSKLLVIRVASGRDRISMSTCHCRRRPTPGTRPRWRLRTGDTEKVLSYPSSRG